MCNIKTTTTSKKIKTNKKTHKTLYKKYRFFGTDLWGTLGRTYKDTNIVQKIAKATYKFIMHHLGTSKGERSEETNRIIELFPAAYKKKFNKEFIYEVANQSDKRMSGHGIRPYSAGGMSRILRRKLVLFYGGGRLRLPTFKVYSKFCDTRNREDQLTILRRRLINPHTLVSILETRADVFFFRIGFFSTIFEARYFCFLRRARIKNFSKYLKPWDRIQALEICFVIDYKKLQKLFVLNLEKKKIIVPVWINLSITFMRAFILYYPSRVGYPGRDMTGAPVKVFQLGF